MMIARPTAPACHISIVLLAILNTKTPGTVIFSPATSMCKSTVAPSARCPGQTGWGKGVCVCVCVYVC